MENLTTENTAKEILSALNEVRVQRGLDPLKCSFAKYKMIAQIREHDKVHGSKDTVETDFVAADTVETDFVAADTDVNDLEETIEINSVAADTVVTDLEETNVVSFPGSEDNDESNESVLSTILNQLEAAGGLFTPAEVDLTLPNNVVVPDKKAIVDMHTSEYISTVGVGYQLISNREVFTQFANVLEASSLNTDGMKVMPTISKSRSYVQFTFPEHRVEVRDNDFTELQILARNSYDGSLRFSLEIGGFRLLCSNGMGIGAYTNVYSNKHSSGYDSEKMAEYLETAVEVFETAGDEWISMTKVPVTDSQALEVLKIMVERKSDDSYEDIRNGKNSLLRDALIEWERYVEELGQNKFALYNTVTHLSSHATTKNGCVVGLRVGKDKVRDKVLSSRHFTDLKAA